METGWLQILSAPPYKKRGGFYGGEGLSSNPQLGSTNIVSNPLNFRFITALR
jgi:hypothetical protein